MLNAYWLAWSQIPGVGAISLKKIYQHFGCLQTAWHAPIEDFREIEGLKKNAIAKRSLFDPQKLLQEHLQQNSLFWTPQDSEYPLLLSEIPSPPPLLYYRGKVELAENRGVAPLIGIVGTRNPTNYGKRWTHKITTALVKHGFGIVSGMAAGVDTVAHHSCLEAGGRTIAVLGTGVDTIYPHSNRQLYQKIQTQGLIISEYPAQTKPDRGNFPARNRIIAGLCRAVLIMEAPTRSGALITARFANDFGRDVYVLPGSLDNTKSLGCLNLLNNGAHVILSESHLLEMLGTMPKLDVDRVSEPIPELAPEMNSLFKIISNEPISLDAIVTKIDLNPGQIMANLSKLEILGLISQLPGMQYCRK